MGRLEPYRRLCTTIYGITGMGVNANDAGGDHDLSPGRGVLAHEMNGELDTVDDGIVENFDHFRVCFRRDPGSVRMSVIAPLP